MASLHEGKNGYWHIKYRNKAGKSQTKSTGTQNKKEAQEKLLEFLLELKVGKAQSIDRVKTEEWIRQQISDFQNNPQRATNTKIKKSTMYTWTCV